MIFPPFGYPKERKNEVLHRGARKDIKFQAPGDPTAPNGVALALQRTPGPSQTPPKSSPNSSQNEVLRPGSPQRGAKVLPGTQKSPKLMKMPPQFHTALLNKNGARTEPHRARTGPHSARTGPEGATAPRRACRGGCGGHTMPVWHRSAAAVAVSTLNQQHHMHHPSPLSRAMPGSSIPRCASAFPRARSRRQIRGLGAGWTRSAPSLRQCFPLSDIEMNECRSWTFILDHLFILKMN